MFKILTNPSRQNPNSIALPAHSPTLRLRRKRLRCAPLANFEGFQFRCSSPHGHGCLVPVSVKREVGGLHAVADTFADWLRL